MLEEDRGRFLELKTGLPTEVDSVTMHYNLALDAGGNVMYSLRRNRLVKREKHFRWIGAVHEYLEVYGRIIHSEIAVTHKGNDHDSDRNLRIYEKRLAQGEPFSPRDLYYYANELSDHREYARAAEAYIRFLDTGEGWVEDNINACLKLGDCYMNLGQQEQAWDAVCRSLLYDAPRAEACCKLGFYLLLRNEPARAVFWYKAATRLEKPDLSLGRFQHECWTWLPHLQLCVCYDRLGDYEKSYFHNEEARKLVPYDERVQLNKAYLEKKLNLPADE
ncbi:hypothetical protein PAECIP111802_04664 [Paenibacillus allorhizosphaerae]|uniref:Tetratricopeptide repeat protein n=1 Tax=Paenibacillus allorhizosphaerae TaxID=2849866 RepID=A0ABM8VMM5_9BACL|nr:hypothetical protein PAECIP111802_04664 [Paenibacillus allorhizosphaerae]